MASSSRSSSLVGPFLRFLAGAFFGRATVRRGVRVSYRRPHKREEKGRDSPRSGKGSPVRSQCSFSLLVRILITAVPTPSSS